MHRSRLTLVAVLVVLLLTSASLTSCGGSGGNPDLVLISFNLPDIAGVTLNQPLIFTFSNLIDPFSITPDTLRVVGSEGPFFETTVVDGNLVALLPRTPNFADYSDVGLFPGVSYNVSMPIFPAVDTIATPDGKPLLEAQSYTFVTQPGVIFVEPFRPISHGTPPSQGGRSDDEGCVQNPGSDLFFPVTFQTGSGPGARLLCYMNEGAPSAIESQSIPRHDQRAVGNASAVAPGLVELPAIRVRCNEFLDPLTVVPYIPTTLKSINVQLWRVALSDGTPLNPPVQVSTNEPQVVQSLDQVEIILVAAGPQQQGIYLVNITPAVTDLPGNALRTDNRPSPAIGGYDFYEAQGSFQAAVPPGWRLYFRTLQLPATPLAITEDFANNLAEWGDQGSGTSEPGIFTQSVLLDPQPAPDGTLEDLPLFPTPIGTRTYTGADPLSVAMGQTTIANWNNGPTSGYRFLGLAGLEANTDAATGLGTLRATWQPYLGSGEDGPFDSPGTGATLGLNTDNGSLDGDGIFEFTSFRLRTGDVLEVTGNKPLLILCQDDFDVEAGATILLNGLPGRFGLDTDGSSVYTNVGAIPTGGQGGLPGPGGGAGGNGCDALTGANGHGASGGLATTLFGTLTAEIPGVTAGGGATGNTDPGGTAAGSGGGGGGGFAAAGGDGLYSSGAAAGPGGSAFGDSIFTRGATPFVEDVTRFQPDRCFSPSSQVTGGCGGGGGSCDDDGAANAEAGDSALGNSDDAGGGGGGGGGAIYVIAGGNLTCAGSVQANGGAGGSTYNLANQAVQDPDGDAGTDNSFVAGLKPAAVPSGDGGPGGGGAGGAIFFVAKGSLSVSGTLSAVGGAGGSSGHASRVGGAGAPGRISLMTFVGGGTVSNTGTTTPAAGAFDNAYAPTVDLASSGQSAWVDLFTPTVDFNPVIAAMPQPPTANTNFDFLSDPMGLNLTRGLGGDYEAAWEFQGADDLAPVPGGPVAPSLADGLTTWVDVSAIDALDGKRYFRWRWRFFVRDGYPGRGLAAAPLPTVQDLTIPFTK